MKSLSNPNVFNIMGYRNDIHDFYINHIKKFRKWYFESNNRQLLVGASITPFNV